MVVYDERNNRLEIVSLLGSRKSYISCVGIDPLREKVLSADEFGDEIRVRVVPKVGPTVGTGVSRIVTYSASQASSGEDATGTTAPAKARDPFASRDPKRRF